MLREVLLDELNVTCASRPGNVRAEVLALPPGHPYLRLPLQFATSLEERLLSLVSADELEELRRQGEAELQEPGRWGTTFTLLQCWASRGRRLRRRGRGRGRIAADTRVDPPERCLI
jgi:hypothetical protein